MIQFLLPLLGALGKGGAALGPLMAKHPGVTSMLMQLAGGLIGKGGQPKTLDPAVMSKLFGAEALGPEFTKTLTTLMNTPSVQNAMSQAAEVGSQFSNDINAKSAGAMGDAGSGMKVFAQAAGNQAAGNIQRQVKGQVSENAMQIAQQNLRDRAAAWANSQSIEQQTPSFQAQLGGNIMNAGAQMLTQPSPTGATTAAAPQVAAPKALIATPTQSVFDPNKYKFGPTRMVKAY